MFTILAVGIGGGLGALLRHYLNTGLAGLLGAPWGTMIVNIAGSIAMGVVIGLFSHVADIPAPWKPFLTTGLLGGFTTFSAFSLDSVLLIERGQVATAALYILGSVVLSLGGLTAGLWGMRLWPT